MLQSVEIPSRWTDFADQLVPAGVDFGILVREGFTYITLETCDHKAIREIMRKTRLSPEHLR